MVLGDGTMAEAEPAGKWLRRLDVPLGRPRPKAAPVCDLRLRQSKAGTYPNQQNGSSRSPPGGKHRKCHLPGPSKMEEPFWFIQGVTSSFTSQAHGGRGSRRAETRIAGAVRRPVRQAQGPERSRGRASPSTPCAKINDVGYSSGREKSDTLPTIRISAAKPCRAISSPRRSSHRRHPS
jgi:hypothetical protein